MSKSSEKPLQEPKKEPVGKYAYELQKKTDEKINPIDMQETIHKGNKGEDSFENQVRIAVERGEKEFEGDFYIVVLFKKERLLHNVVRQYFFPRKSCPLPEFDQVVYKFHRNSGTLDFLWVVPDQAATVELPKIRALLPLEQQGLLEHIEAFNSGKLDALCASLNNEV